MEAETIDLTDPLEDLLRQTGLSPEHLQERILRLSEENGKNANINQKDIKEMTLSDLLEGYKCASSTRNKYVEVTETIELSDDEVEVIDDVTNKRASEIQDVNEVRVIEINDDNDSEYDDDDEFLEESTTDILHSNSKDIYESSLVLNDDVDSNLTVNENTSNSLRPVNAAESKEPVAPHSKDRIFKSYDKTYDLAKNKSDILLKQNDEKRCHSNDLNTPRNTAKNVIIPTAVAASGISSEIIKGKLLSKYEDEQDDSNNSKKKVEIKDQEIRDKDVDKFLSFNSGSSSGSSFKSALSKIDELVDLDSAEHVENTNGNNTNAISNFDESIRSKTFESNRNTSNNKSGTSQLDESILNNDLGFNVSLFQGGVDLIDSTMKVTKIAIEEANTNVDKTVEPSGNLMPNQDLTFNKRLVSNTVGENMHDINKLNSDGDSNTITNSASKNVVDQKSLFLVSSDNLFNNSTFDIQGIKSMNTQSIQKSIDNIIEQLDLACHDDNIENNRKKVNINNVIDAPTITPATESKVIQASNNSLKIDSSTRLLLNSLDEAIKTCDKSNEELNNFVQKNAERNKKLSQTLEIAPDVENTSCEHYKKLDKINKEPLSSNSIAESINNTSMTGSCNDCITDNDEFSRESVNNTNSDKTNDLLKMSPVESVKNINKITVDKKAKSTTDKEESNDALYYVVSNSRDQNSKHFLLGSVCQDNSITNDTLDNDVRLKQSDVQEKSDHMELIGSDVKESFIDSIAAEPEKINHNPPLLQDTNMVLEASDNIMIKNLVASANVKSEIPGPTQPFIPQTTVDEDVRDKNVQTNSSSQETLIDSISSLKSEKVISNQLSVLTDTDVQSNESMKRISSAKEIIESMVLKSEKVNLTQLLAQQSNQEWESSNMNIQHCCPADKTMNSIFLTNDSEKVVPIHNQIKEKLGNSNQLIQTNEKEDLSDKNIQPVNSKVKETCMDLIRVEPEKIISHQLLTQPTDVEWDQSTKPISSPVKENFLPIVIEACSSKTVEESLLKRDIFTTNKNLLVAQSQYNDSDEDDNTEENICKNFEEIRKNLKLQLTSLRNRKRMDILQDVKTKVLDIEGSRNSSSSDRSSRDLNLIDQSEDLVKLVSNKANQNSNENLHPINQDSQLNVLPELTIQSKSTIDIRGSEYTHKIPVEPDHLAETSQLESIKENTDDKNTSLKQYLVPLIVNSADKVQLGLVTEQYEDEDVSNVLNEIRKIIRKPKTAPKIPLSKSIHNLKDTENKNVGNESQKDYKTESKKRDNHITTELLNSTIAQDDETQIFSNPETKNTLSSSVVISPFISNTLDEFLTDAKLNVSYTIPKSGAEEGLRQNYSEDPIMPQVIAEVKEEDNEKVIQEIKYKPKTLAEKRRLLEKNKLKEKKRLEKLKKLEEAQKHSYVLFKDKKIFLKAKSMSKCIASIESSICQPTTENSQPTTSRKPSLLTELYKKATTPVKYKPGPLCRKHLLQTDYSNWITELQTLPKVTLKLLPQLGKPIHRNLLHILPEWDGEVTDDQIEFALSALITKEKPKQNKVFEFGVPYENRQTQILTRKRTLDKPPVKLDNFATTKEYFSTAEQDVTEVIEKLLNYVEIKEIAPTLIKYDKDLATSDNCPVETEVQPVGNHCLIKRKSRFSKTNRELLRLNCKVVSVEVEENELDEQCSKPYCRLGCICKSLQCERIIGLHCQKVKCIFGCSCPKEKDKIISIAEPTIKLPAGTDLLSMDTVTRIEGEAKRNLAKLEKEFTQTVIHTNDKTIVVGFGNKPRRATKTPKKYTFDDDIPKEETKEPKKEEIISVRQCSVVLENWDFSDIIPYCLVHHLYKCHCRGLSTFAPNISFENFKKESGELLKLKKEEILSSSENNTSTLINKNNKKNQLPKQTVEESFKAIIRKSEGLEKNIDSESDFEETLYSVTGRPLRKRKKIYEADFVFDIDAPSSSRKLTETNREPYSKPPAPVTYLESSHCSRTREISKKYYRKVTSFTNAALYFDFANNLTQADLLKSLQPESQTDMTESDTFKRTIIEDRKKLLEDTETEIHKKKRKQKIQVRKDENLIIKTTEKVVAVPKPAPKVDKVKSVFKGEIIVNDSEWLKKLGQNAKQPLEGYARILPWTALLNGFLSKSVNIYCITDMPLRLLLNVGQKLSGEKIMDVETFGHKILAIPLKASAAWLLSQSENVREIIKWLLSGTLPSRYKTTGLSFLLVETFPGQFEVRGLCTQGENKPSIQENQADLPDEGEISDQLTEVKHKNMDGQIGSLFITKGKFRLRELVEDGCDDDHTDNLYMWVGLPEVYKVAKWRVVFLNNDFAYLYFKNIKYSIKYTDLVKLTEMAKEEVLTLVLRNVEIRRSYEHNAFGIYISHNYIDRIFIGPYFINYDDDEVETLRYINQQLVSSECFNKMTGTQNSRCGHWMYERTYCHTPKVYMKDTIDLTKDDTSPKPSKRSQQKLNTNVSVSLPTNSTPIVRTPQPLGGQSTKDDHIIYHNGMSIHIKNSKPRSPSEFNRFIITNIPHFGYLGAYQPDNSSTLEVSWPFEKKVLQFENADNARDFLQERFNQLLQPVPETFKIQVIVLIQLDLKEHQPINSDFLSGHCICGYFGTYNFREITNEFCKQKLNISKEEITKLFAKRAHAYIRKKIEELAEIVEINQNDCVNFNVPTILDKARADIKSQESIRRKHVTEIQAYELEVVAKMKKLYKLVNILPIKQRNIESKIINEILQIRPKRLGANEVVEIKDDDDEDRPSTNFQSDSIVYIESDDAIVPEQPKNKPLKRKRIKEKKSRTSKMGKAASVTLTPGPLTSDLKPNRTLKVAGFSQNTNKSKPITLLARPTHTEVQSSTGIVDREIVAINEDTETIIINEELEPDTINEDMETVTFNDDLDRVTFSDIIETLTVNDDMDPKSVNKNVEPLANNEDIEMLTVNNIEIENLLDENDDNQYIIEYDADNYDPNVTEIIVSQPDRAENIDLSKATIIASVPPSSTTNDDNSVPVSVLNPKIQTPLIKTYSKYKKSFATDSKELTGKIKLGLQKIMKKSEGNLLLLKDISK